MLVKEASQFWVSIDHLIEWIYFDNVESHKRALERRYAPLIHKFLLRCHEVECGQAYHITHFYLIQEWFDEPAS